MISKVRGDDAAGDAREGAIAIVVVEKATLISSIPHEQIDPAIVIKIGPGSVFGSPAIRDYAARRDLGEGRIDNQRRGEVRERTERGAHHNRVLAHIRWLRFGDDVIGESRSGD